MSRSALQEMLKQVVHAVTSASAFQYPLHLPLLQTTHLLWLRPAAYGETVGQGWKPYFSWSMEMSFNICTAPPSGNNGNYCLFCWGSDLRNTALLEA